jgi:Fe-S-cluster containining protein
MSVWGIHVHDPEVCHHCATQGQTCCRVTPGQGELCFPLSAMEMDRIRDFAPAYGWFVKEPNTSAFVDAMCRLFPGEEDRMAALFPRRKFHDRLATTRSGGCVFLSEAGCELPWEARPYYCRLAPVWVSGGRLTLLDHKDCLAMSRGDGVVSIMESMGLSRTRIHDLHSRLRLAWGLPPEPGARCLTNFSARNDKC